MNQSMDNGLVCVRCGRLYAITQPIWRCACGGVLDIQFRPVFDLERIRVRKPDLWRYREALALEMGSEEVSFGEGFTPLLPVHFGKHEVLVKQDHLFPTGSYKDRGAAVMISQVKALKIDRVVEDSSGNAGCAVAAYCAKAGIACDIYVPASTSQGKLVQIERYGARLHRIPGSREDTARAVETAAEQYYYASHSWNPFFFQGTKTFAFEVCEQLGWKAPDTVVLPAGNGTLLLGAELGFRELRDAGIIPSIPKIIAVQSDGCAPLAAAFEIGADQPQVVDPRATMAEGIAIASPVRGWQILRAVRASGGNFLRVSEEEIHAALLKLCSMGFYVEPTSAATIAGVEKYISNSAGGERIVSVFTGHGLKASEKMAKL